jgi:inhibitor of KinA
MQAIVPNTFPYKVYSLSENAVTIEFGNKISEDIFQQVSNFNRLITKNPFAGFKTTLPAYATLTIFFDPLQVVSSPQLKGIGCLERIKNYLIELDETVVESVGSDTNTITIPVCYGNAFGPDLDFVSAHSKLSVADIIKHHTEAIYKVYMLGFVPGFAYLGGLPAQLEMPRKPVPRKAVPAGSVGIAAMQTAVYPLQTPGGWQIIGRTPLKLFDVKKENPLLLKAGDHVVFKSIDEAEFEKIAGRTNAD